MDAGLKEKWIKALRSGEYEQTQGLLHRGETGFCCLGVLCEISGLGRWGRKDSDAAAYEVGTEVSWFGPPQPVREIAGLTLEQAGELWRMNDGMCGKRKHNFSEIADYIEENL